MLRRPSAPAPNWFALLAGLLTTAAFMAALDNSSRAQTKADPQGKPKTDQSGDPLPPGALARMGTLRWRHGTNVAFVAFTPDGKTVLTASQDNVIRLWERDTGKEIRRFEAKAAAPQPPVGGGGPIVMGFNPYVGGGTHVALSPDGKMVAATVGNVIHQWDIETGKEIRQIKGPQNGALSILFAPDGKSLALRGFDRVTYLLETETGKEIHKIKTKQNPAKGNAFVIVAGGRGNGDPAGLAFSPDGKTIATAEIEVVMQKTNAYVKISDTTTGNEIRQIDTSPNGASAIAYSPDGKILAFAAAGTIHLREAGTDKEIRQIANKAAVANLLFAADNKTLAAKGRDQIIRLFDATTGDKLHEFGETPAPAGGNQLVFFGIGGPAADIRDIAFAPGGKVLAFGGSRALRFFDVSAGKEQASTGGHRGPVSAIIITPDGKTMFSRAADSVIRRWDAATGKELGQFHEPAGTASVAFSPDGKTAALSLRDGTIRLLAADDGKPLQQFKGHPNGAATLVFSADGKTLASRGAGDNTIRVHDAIQGTELKQITLLASNPGGGIVIGGFGGGPAGQALAFSPDGRTLVATNNAGNSGLIFLNDGGAPQPTSNALFVYSVATGKEMRKLPLPPGRTVAGLAYSPDGRTLAIESSDQAISLVELASGRERAVLGQAVAVAQPNNQPALPLRRLGRVVMAPASASLAFSSDGAFLASRGPDNAVRVWDAIDTKVIGQFKGHDGPVQTVAFAPNGKSLASGSADTTILVWDLTTLKKEPKAAAALQPKELETLWADLIDADAAKAYRAILTMAAAPAQATPFLRERLKPAAPVDAKKIDEWLVDLNSSNFPKRTKANTELEKLGELALPALRKVLAAQPTVETQRRIEILIEKATTGVLSAEQIRLVRALEVLEKLATTDARQLVQALAQGAPGALPTREAQTVLNRLTK